MCIKFCNDEREGETVYVRVCVWLCGYVLVRLCVRVYVSATDNA